MPDLETATLMVAIAGAESAWFPEATGDSPALLEALGFPGSANLARTWNCPLGSEEGPASAGLWQIFMPVWRDGLIQLGAPADPCGMLDWLIIPANNARAAALVLSNQGFTAWSTFNDGSYLPFMSIASEAVERARIRPNLRHIIFASAIFGLGIVVLGRL